MCSVIRRQAKVETQNLASHKGGCVINLGDKCLLLLRLLLVRRKILRLYWADAVIYISRACFYNIQAAVS